MGWHELGVAALAILILAVVLAVIKAPTIYDQEDDTWP